MDNYNNLGINLFLNFLNKLGPLVEDLNIRNNLLEDRIKKDVKEFNNKQVIKLTRMAFEDREEYFDVEINKLNFSIRKAEQNYQYNKVEYLSALKKELEFISEHHSCIEYKKKSKKEENFIYSESRKFDENLELLFKGLTNEGYIDCTLGTFKAIFKEYEIKQKVDWKKALSSLHYFINQLLKKNKFSVKDKWVVTVKCFTHDSAKIDKNNLAKASKISSKNLIKINSVLKLL